MALIGVGVWTATGVVIAELLTLITTPSNAYAAAGIALVVGALAWALGPSRTPMMWSEGMLPIYEGNADRHDDAHPRRWRLIAVPAFALAAGALLIVVAGVMATR